MVGARTKPCSFCGKTKKLSDFYAHNGKKTNGQSSWCKSFGGLKAFCAEWMRHINDAATDRPGSKLVLDAFYAVGIRLTSLSADHRQSAPDLASLTDDELEEEIGKMVANLLDNRPELINELAGKHGLKIHDPVEVEVDTA